MNLSSQSDIGLSLNAACHQDDSLACRPSRYLPAGLSLTLSLSFALWLICNCFQGVLAAPEVVSAPASMISPESGERWQKLTAEADAAIKQHDFAAAKQKYGEALSLFPQDNWRYVESLRDLAACLQEAGDHAESYNLYRKGLSIMEAQAGKNDQRLDPWLANLGTLADRVGRKAEAESYLERLCAMRNAVFPSDNPELVAQRMTLVQLYLKHGENQKALLALEPLLKLPAKAFPPVEAGQFGAAIDKLSTYLQQQGRSADAARIVDKQIEFMDRGGGANSCSHAVLLFRQAHSLRILARYKESAAVALRCWKLQKKLPVSAHERVSTGIVLTMDYIELHQPERALAIANANMQLLRADASLSRVYEGPVRYQRGLALLALHRYDQAKIDLEKALQFQESHGGDADTIAWYIRALAQCLHDMGRNDDALALLRPAVLKYKTHKILRQFLEAYSKPPR